MATFNPSQNNLGNFAGGFLRAFTTARSQRRKNDLLEALTKVKIQQAQKSAKREAEQDAALERIVQAFTGTAQPGEELGGITPAPGTQGIDPSQILSDPSLLGDALQSGQMDLPKLIAAGQSQQTLSQTGALLNQFIPGAGGTQSTEPVATTFPPTSVTLGAAPTTGTAPATGGLALEDVVIRPGKPPAFKLAPKGPGAKIANRRLDPTDPTRMIEEDKFGNVINVRPASLDEIEDLDKPASPATLKLFETIDEKGQGTGRSPQGVDLRELEDPTKFRLRETKLPMSDATRIALMNQGVKDLGKMLNILVDDKGEVKKSVLLKMTGGGFGEGLEVNQLAFTGVAGLILAISGVAVRPEERENVMAAFVPSLRDLTREGLAQRKVERFKNLLEGNIDAILPSLPASLQERIRGRRTQEGGSFGAALPEGIPVGSKFVFTSGGNPVYETPEGKRLVVEP